MATANNDPKCGHCRESHWTERCPYHDHATEEAYGNAKPPIKVGFITEDGNIENLPPQPTNTAKATSFKLELARVADSIEVKCHRDLPSYLGAYHAYEITQRRKDEALAMAFLNSFVTLAPCAVGKPVLLAYHQAKALAQDLRTIAKAGGKTTYVRLGTVGAGVDENIAESLSGLTYIFVDDDCEELYWAIADAVLAEPVREEDIIPNPNLPFKFGDDRDQYHPGNHTIPPTSF